MSPRFQPTPPIPEVPGIGVLIAGSASWSIVLSTLGFGMLCHMMIMSPGYYVERGNTQAVVMFGGLWLLATPAIILRLTVV